MKKGEEALLNLTKVILTEVGDTKTQRNLLTALQQFIAGLAIDSKELKK